MYYEKLILWSTAESIIQIKPFPGDFCMSDKNIDSNKLSKLLSLIIVSAFEDE